MLVFLLLVVIAILSVSLIKIRRHNHFDTHLETFINLNNNITVVTSKTEIILINQVGLDFFNFSSKREFCKKHKYISKLFKEIILNDEKYVVNIDWVTVIDKVQNIKVEMSKDGLEQFFNMQVSKINEDRYQISFYNISRMLAEKNAIEKVAEIDELTQIYNRKKFNTLLTLALRNAEIYEESFTIIFFDIDHFKRVNDTYGHTIGDKVLIQLTSLVKSQLRSHDIFARWGGEEFVLLSESSSSENTYLFATRLRKVIEEFPFDTIGNLTCSFGVSRYRKNDTAESIIVRADDALYEAKENGRNQVCM